MFFLFLFLYFVSFVCFSLTLFGSNLHCCYSPWPSLESCSCDGFCGYFSFFPFPFLSFSFLICIFFFFFFVFFCIFLYFFVFFYIFFLFPKDLPTFKWACGSCCSTLLEFGEEVVFISVKPDRTFQYKKIREMVPFAFSKATLDLNDEQ